MKLELTNTHLERLQVQDLRNEIVQKLKKTHRKLAEQQSKLGELRRAKVRGEHSIETKIFKVLKEIGIELSSYHGGSLNGKDIKKVMNNATHIFDEFAAILRNGARVGCVLSNDGIDSMCLHFREVFVLWDGAFSLARTMNPTPENVRTYRRFVDAALHGSQILLCPITPKVHAMVRHVAHQMTHLPGGLGDKMEDWVERLHQWGIQQRRRFRTVQNPMVRVTAREKANSRCSYPDVLAQVDATDARNKRTTRCPPRENSSVTRDGLEPLNISQTLRTWSLPGRNQYLTMGLGWIRPMSGGWKGSEDPGRVCGDVG